MKTCTICKELKSEIYFDKNRTTLDGYHGTCKICRRQSRTAYRNSKQGLISRIYEMQVQNSKKRKHSIPTYTRDELETWITSQYTFNKLYDAWVASNYDSWNRPSCDRIDNNRGYSFDNILLTTWYKNSKNGHLDRTLKSNDLGNKRIFQYTKSGYFIAEYVSTHYAAKVNRTFTSSITNACKGITNTAEGYIWKYAKDTHEFDKQLTLGVSQYSIGNKLIKSFKSIIIAANATDILAIGILNTALGLQNSAGGSHWKFNL